MFHFSLLLFTFVLLTGHSFIDEVREALLKDDQATAINVCTKAIASSPTKNSYAFVLLGKMYQSMGKISLALHNFQLYFKHVKNPELNVHRNIFECHQKLGKLEEALEFISHHESAFSKEPQKLVEWKNEITVLKNNEQLAKSYLEKNDIKGAVEILERLEKQMSHKQSLIRDLAKYYTELGQVDKAMSRFKRLVAYDPNDTEGIFLFVNFLFKNCKISDAVTYLQKCLHVDMDNVKCKSLYRKLKKLNTLVTEINNMLEGRAYGNMKSPIDKTQKFVDQNDVKQQCLDSFLLMANCHYLGESLDDVEMSLRVCNKALEVFEKDSSEYFELLRSRINIYINKSELDLAKSDAQILIGKFPNDPAITELNAKINRLIKKKGKRNYYSILGVKKTDSKKTILSAYRKLALLNHPDKFSDPEDKRKAEAKMRDLNDSRDVLTDPKKRKMFDSGIDPLDPEESQSHENAHYSHGGQRTIFVDPNNFNFFGHGGGDFAFNF